MKNLTWQNPEQLFVAQELINKVKSKCCGIKENNKTPYQGACLNLIYKFDFGKKVKVKRAKSIQTTSDSYLRK